MRVHALLGVLRLLLSTLGSAHADDGVVGDGSSVSPEPATGWLSGSVLEACETTEVHDGGFMMDLEQAWAEQSRGVFRWAILVAFCVCTLFRLPLSQSINRALGGRPGKLTSNRGLRVVQFMQLALMDFFMLWSLLRGNTSAHMAALLISLTPALSFVEAIVDFTLVKGEWNYFHVVISKPGLERTWRESRNIPLPDFLKPPATPSEDLRYRWAPSNLYGDFSADIVRVCTIFIAQVALVIIVVLYFREREFTTEVCGRRAVFQFFCTLVLQTVADYQAGGRFVDELSMWSFLYSAYEFRDSGQAEEDILCPVYREGDKGFDDQAKCSSSQHGHKIRNRKGENLRETEVLARGCMSFVVNGVAYDFFIYFMPLILTTSENLLDFVLNAFAIFFVVEMDDITKTSNIMLLDDYLRYSFDVPCPYWPHHESYERGSDPPVERELCCPFQGSGSDSDIGSPRSDAAS
eukprot:TRINITY_DN7832_c0_g2_i1.p1 TRINITY_DN7832_c0_g2~~TRINITY_DN7832_c0_g2_i1.p1  ORF type:complete len:490 (-),score=61.77 TRINITY_DN7832_c0_g2_i1:306-1697(-)